MRAECSCTLFKTKVEKNIPKYLLHEVERCIRYCAFNLVKTCLQPYMYAKLSIAYFKS